MEKFDERMELISSAIVSQADTQSKEIIRNAESYRVTELKRFTEQATFAMYDTIQSAVTKIRLEAVKSTAQYELEAHRALLERREGYRERVFSNLRARLCAYTETGEYRAALLRDARAIKETYSQLDHTHSVLRLREADMALAGDLAVELPGVEVEPDGAIQIGGFTLFNKAAKLLLDETLNSRLQDQLPWFLQQCGMRISVE